VTTNLNLIRAALTVLAAIFNHRFSFWFLLAIPSIPLLADFIYEQRYYAEMMYDSGVWSVQWLLLSLLITPLSYWASSRPDWLPLARWWIRRRRYIGVACFAYALINMVVYLRNVAEWETILAQAGEWEYLLGWVGFVILLLLTATSNDASVRALQTRWKYLHRFSYMAVLLIGLHWLMFGIFLNLLCFFAACFALLLAFRLVSAAASQNRV
jgi:sulfoxide reductase heme-binding subunit YedZ